MKKNYIILSVIVAIILMTLSILLLYKNNNQIINNTINIDSSLNNQSINVKKGNILNIILSNPGSGGYQFDDPEFNLNILKIKSHTHKDPTTNLVGNFGEDEWKFEAINSGQTDLIFYISRPWEQQKEINFKITINVQ